MEAAHAVSMPALGLCQGPQGPGMVHFSSAKQHLAFKAQPGSTSSRELSLVATPSFSPSAFSPSGVALFWTVESDSSSGLFLPSPGKDS